MTFLIDKSGRITKSKIESSSGHPLLDNAALTALNKCKFKPATVNGKIISAWTKVDYVWKLPD
jgi:TonB family protein